MSADKKPHSPSGKRAVFAPILLGFLAVGILFLSWKDIYSEIPKFEQLQETRANGFRAEIARESWSPLRYSIEFYDGSGKRYQVSSVEKPAFDQIKAALSTEVPVLIRFGQWRSPFPSKKIFTVYQLEVGERTIIPYARLATARQREQSAGPIIILVTILLAGIAAFIGARSQINFKRRVALHRSRSTNETRS